MVHSVPRFGTSATDRIPRIRKDALAHHQDCSHYLLPKETVYRLLLLRQEEISWTTLWHRCTPTDKQENTARFRVFVPFCLQDIRRRRREHQTKRYRVYHHESHQGQSNVDWGISPRRTVYDERRYVPSWLRRIGWYWRRQVGIERGRDRENVCLDKGRVPLRALRRMSDYLPMKHHQERWNRDTVRARLSRWPEMAYLPQGDSRRRKDNVGWAIHRWGHSE